MRRRLSRPLRLGGLDPPGEIVANLGKGRASALQPSPIGSPFSDSVCEIGPSAIVLEITTIPISESVLATRAAARTLYPLPRSSEQLLEALC
jgi:hypothetical protein